MLLYALFCDVGLCRSSSLVCADGMLCSGMFFYEGDVDMRHRLVLCAVLLLAAVRLLGQATLGFPSSERIMTPSNWNENTVGTMSCTYDSAEKALRFDVLFEASTKDRWCYPQFMLKKSETLNGVKSITFDIKATGSVKMAFFMFGAGDVAYKMPAAGTWGTVSLKLPEERAKTTMLPKFAIGANPHDEQFTYWLKNIRFEGTPIKRVQKPGVVGDAPGMVFVEGQDVVLECTRVFPSLTYSVKNWRGKEIFQGSWPENGKQKLNLGKLQPGYYTVSTKNASSQVLKDVNFTVVIDPKTRVFDPNSFFAVDTAQSWLARPGAFECPYFDGDSYKLVSELVYLAGIPHVRERLAWRHVQERRGSPLKLSYYGRNAQLLKERGITISGMFHDSPGWADKLEKLPGNLVDVYNFCRDVSREFGDCMGDWEFWNEQDIKFAPEPVWDYAPAMKAAYLGFRAGNPSRIVANGAICTGSSNPYVHVMYLNDLAKYTDIYNFHTYSPVSAYEKMYKVHYEMLKAEGMSGRAIWCTESGTNLEGLAEGPGLRPNMKEHTPEQEMILAEFFPKSQVAHAMNGCVRNYYFVFAPCNERNGGKSWGIMRRDSSVKPTYAAFSTMTGLLVSAKIQGELRVGEGLKAYLYDQPDGTQTLVYWTITDLDTSPGKRIHITSDCEKTFELKVADGTYDLTDLVGTRSKGTAKDGKLQLVALRYPAYVSGLRGMKADVPAIPQGKVQRYTPPTGEDMTILFSVELNKDDFTVQERKSRACMSGMSGRLKVKIWNIDEKPKSGSVSVKGGTLSGLPETIALPAMGYVEYDVVFKPTHSGDYLTELELTGTFEGRTSTRFVIPVTLTGEYMAKCRKVNLRLEDVTSWRRNDSAQNFSITYDEAEKAVKFQVEWTKECDRWFYPEHILELPAETLKGARFLQFEVKSKQDKVENDFKTHLLMLVESVAHQRGKAHNFYYDPPLEKWETRTISLERKSTNLETIRQIRIGANPLGHRLEFWLRNVRILYAD